MIRRGLASAVGLLLLASPLRAGEVASVVPAQNLVHAFEAAAVVVVGEVTALEDLGARHHAARFVPERAIAAGEAAAAYYATFTERAPSRPPRLAVGDRVLLGLEPRVATSSWRTRSARLPGDVAQLAIAAEGGAFLRTPSGAELTVLDHFLRLPAADRGGAAGVRHLLSLAANAQEPLARAAARRLATTEDARLAPAVAALALAALSRGEGSGVPEALVAWIERKRPEALVAPLDAALAADDPMPTLVRARSALPGDIEPHLAALAADPRPEMRAEVARTTSDPERWAALAQDPDGQVREAAVARRPPGDSDGDGAASLGVLEVALGDTRLPVRSSAARSLAAYGDVAVPRLLRVCLDAKAPARETALAGLALVRSAAAAEALVRIEREHADPGIRELARIALHREFGDVHPVDP